MMRFFIMGFLELKQWGDQKIKKKKKKLENWGPDLSCLKGKSDFLIQFPDTNPVHSWSPLNKETRYPQGRTLWHCPKYDL